MEKTAKEWFEEISHEPTRLRAINNVELDYLCESLEESLLLCFDWETSVEGGWYWEEVFTHFDKGLNDPKTLSEIENKYLKNAD